MSETENNISLVLSQRAAKLLDFAIETAVDEQLHFGPEADILERIQEEIRDQLPKKAKAKKPKAKKRK